MRHGAPLPVNGPTLALAAGIALGCFAFARGFATWRRKRTVEDTPRARVRSMALGRVALEGKAAPWVSDLRAPLSGVECCWYRFRVEEERYNGKQRQWYTVASGDSAEWPFFLEDQTGRVLVQPRGAQMVVANDLHETNPDLSGGIGARLAELGVDATSFLGLSRPIRVTEARLVQGDAVYVLGVAQTRPSLRDERRAALQERISALKGDREAMKRLDTDGDGVVSADEWEVARQALVSETEAAPAEDRVVVARPPGGGGDVFLIADRAEAALAHSLGWQAWSYVLGGAVLALGSLWGLLDRLGMLGRS